MELFLALALLAVSTLAQAMPAVGDTATYQGTLVNNHGQTMQFQTVITLQSFDQAQQKFQEVSTTTAANIQPIVDTKWVGPSDLISDPTIQQVLSNCAGQGGISETITVPAGTFPTCRITDQQGGASYNVGAVPFGVVKGIQTQNSLQMELSSFVVGH